MTRKRNDEHGTEFGDWLREQKEIDSSLGFVTTNIDYVWLNYKTGDWMIIEEKRYSYDVTFSQKKIFKMVHQALKSSLHKNKYHGLHLLVFENTSPDDGKIFLDRKEITKEVLFRFLTFQKY